MQTLVPESFRQRFGSRVRPDEMLAVHTSFRIGGPADLFISARSRDDVVDALSLAEATGLPWLVLGRGSNVLISEAGVRGLVIRLDAQDLQIDREARRVQADAGVRLPTIGAQTARLGLVGCEFTVGIPGSVGGGVVMNAGSHGGCIADVLESAEVWVKGVREEWPASAFEHGYRTSRLQRERAVIVLGARFQLTEGSSAEALARVQSYRQHRHDTQPTDPGAGSIFRNPEGDSAGGLIDRAGLKGTRHGGAMISPKHGNFIINAGGATSDDVLALVDLAQATVFDRSGILLQTEVELIGPQGRYRRAATRP